MKILFLTRRYFPFIGGVETHVEAVTNQLIRKGHNVSIITEGEDGPIGTISEDDVRGARIARAHCGRPSPLKKFRLWLALWRLRTYIKDADVVHCHDVFFWYAPFRFVYPTKRVFTTFHGYETAFPPAKKAIVIRKMSEWLSYGSIAVGEYIKKWYHARPDVVLYGGIDSIHPFKSHIAKKTLNILLIGRLEPDIGIATYFKAFQILKQRDIPFELTVLGDGSLRQDLSKIGSVKGFVPSISSYIKQTDVLCASSYLTILEGLSYGASVVATCENELKKDYLTMSPFAEFINITENADELADMLQKPHKPDAKKLTEFLKTHTWQSVTETYLELWKK